jgi:hypothetical protein
VALAELGVKTGTVDLTVFAPPGMYKTAKENLVKRLSGRSAEIKLRRDKTWREWTYETVRVVPEGIGAAACFILDNKGQPTSGDVLAGDVLVIDSGVFTLDVLKLTNGAFNPESLQHATWKNGGLDAHMRQPLLRGIHKAGRDFTITTVDDTDSVFRNAIQKQDATLAIAGKSINLQDALDDLSKRYAEYIANNVIDTDYDGLTGIRSVALVGGGAYFVAPYLRNWYGDKIATIEKPSPVELNAEGGLRLAIRRLNG